MVTPTNWHKQHKAHLTLGERAADKMRNGMGSWLFVGLFLVFMAIWAFLNTQHGLYHWDKYPFILLNLFLSMLAGLQGAILLIAAKRADGISGAMAEHDYRTNVEAEKEIQELMTLHQDQIVMLKQLTAKLDHLAKQLDDRPHP